MERNYGNKMVLVFAITIILSLSLVGCKTHKTLTEAIIEHVHDTIEVVKADTVEKVKVEKDSVIEYRLLAIHDTTFIDRGSIIVLNEAGDTIKQHDWSNTLQKTHEKENSQHTESHTDSTSYYKATVDSLRAALHEAKSKEKVVVKTKYILRWWEWGIIGVLAVALIAAVIKRSIKKF